MRTLSLSPVRLFPTARERATPRPDAWVRPALAAVTALAAFLYFWHLSINGYANTYYSAAALAASESWKAWFFGSFDAGSFITVDKPPLSTMLMGLSVRLFGLSSFSILAPQALAGVATVVVLFQAVRRSFGPVAGLIAAVVMALTPVAVLMFRFNNPDAVLTLLLVSTAWAVLRGLENGRFRWAILASVLIGLAFLTKYLQAYLVLPAFALVWLVAAHGHLRRRIAGLAIAAVTTLVASGWWVAIADSIPAALRPYIGGSTNNSTLDLLFGYDGLSRIFGFLRGRFGIDGGGGGVDGGGGAGFGGTPGLFRLFNSEFVGQISWLIPFAVIALIAGLVIHARAQRTDRARGGYLLWGGWFLVTAGVFSYMSGIIHPYYTVALAPAIAALVGAGTVDLWRLRSRSIFGGIGLAVAVLVTAFWGARLLATTPAFATGLGTVALVAAFVAAAVLVVPARIGLGRASLVAAVVALAAVLAGPFAYSLDTVASVNDGALPSAGPAVAGTFGGPGGGVFGRGGDGAVVRGGGPGQATTTSASLVDFLVANKGDATWIVAVSGSQEAGSIELASGEAVMAMGGFSGSDPAPTLAQLQEYVRSGQLRYILIGGGGGPGGGFGGGGSSSIASWVAANGTVVNVAGGFGTLYDLAAAK
ncbi:MAG: glycosyltransferase family 39 protein [Chloroflexota bacterium]